MYVSSFKNKYIKNLTHFPGGHLEKVIYSDKPTRRLFIFILSIPRGLEHLIYVVQINSFRWKTYILHISKAVIFN